MDRKDFNTVAIHAGDIANGENAHLTPIYASSTFHFESAGQGMRRFSGEEPGYLYSRFANPTTDAAASAIAALEAFGLQEENGTPLQLKAILHSSGQSAMATLFLANVQAGDSILSHHSLYGGTHEFLYDILPRFGINSLVADFGQADRLEALVRETPGLKLIHIETPANPTMKCTDLEMVCRIAHDYGVRVSVDNTFATPYLQQPFRYGADFVFHSTTKFLNGHGSAIGGVLIGRDIEFMETTGRRFNKLLGGCSSPFDAFLLLQGMKTLAIRMEKHCANALKVAEFLCSKEAVAAVHYNGLRQHPDHLLTKKQMRHAGAVLSFELKGGLTAGKKFIDRLQLCTRAVSVGTADTLLSHPASMSHAGMQREDRLRAGISDGLIRMSVGMEEINDILNDLDQALNA